MAIDQSDATKVHFLFLPTDIRKVFKIYDKNGDGWINANELTNVMQMLGNNPTPKYMREVMKEADKDGKMIYRCPSDFVGIKFK